MIEFHVGLCAGDIYAGTVYKLKKDGYSVWRNKSIVTDDAIRAVAQYLIDKDSTIEFKCRDKKYVLTVREVSE